MYSGAEFDVEFDGKHRLPHKIREIRHSENSTFSTHFLHKSSSPEDRPPSTNIERMSVKSENFPGETKKIFPKNKTCILVRNLAQNAMATAVWLIKFANPFILKISLFHDIFLTKPQGPEHGRPL